MLNQRAKKSYSANTKSLIENTLDTQNISAKLKNAVTILLVEDNEIISIVLAEFLKNHGYNVVIARNGKDAIHLLKKTYDLILLDIGLPDISGIEVCQIIKNQKKFSHIPVIFLTAFGEEVQDSCMKAGADDFATKPINETQLINLVNRWL